MARDLFIIRGLPSAGKSTLANIIAPRHNTSMLQTRKALMLQGVNEGAARRHARSIEMDLLRDWMQQGATPIAIHDVSAERDNVRELMYAAITNGYRWHVVHVETDMHDGDLAARSETECPATAIAEMRAKWEHWGNYGS